MKRILTLVLLIAAVSCSKPKHTKAELQQTLPGMKRDQVVTLLGKPGGVTYSGSIENWYYTGDIAYDADAKKTLRILHLTLVNSTVRDVEF